MNKKDVYRYIAGCLGIAIVIKLIVDYNINLISNFINNWDTVLTIVSYLLISLGLFFKKKLLPILGIVILILLNIYAIIDTALSFEPYLQNSLFSFFGFSDYSMIFYLAKALIQNIAGLFILLLVLILCLSKSNVSKGLGVSAFILRMLLYFVSVMSFSFSFKGLIVALMYGGIWLFLGLGWASIVGEAPKKETKHYQKPASDMENFEKIAKLKELLDIGAITQEEFDIKKKQLLGI